MLGVISKDGSSSLVRLLEYLGIPFERIPVNVLFDEHTRFNALVIIADDYPCLPSDLPALIDAIALFRGSNKPVFCEFLPVEGIFSPEVVTKAYTRLISRDRESPVLDGIEAGSLLETHQNPFLGPDKSMHPTIIELLSFGRVAGVYKADYCLPTITYPGLVQQDNLIAASIKLSDFDKMEYRLKSRFCHLMMNICRFLCGTWHPLVVERHANPYDNRQYMDAIKELDERERELKYMVCLLKGLDWYESAGMFPRPLGVGGVYEGFTSAFGPQGQKSYRFHEELGYKVQRADCTADSALPFLLASLMPPGAVLTENKRSTYKTTSENLFNELYTYWQHYPAEGSILRGFFGWANTPYDITVAYSDDNGRVVLECLLHAFIKRDRDLFARGFAGVNALRSTVGKNGHRWSRIDLKHFYQKKGRKWFNTHKVTRWRYGSPHYDAWTLAALLYGGLLIDERPIIDLAEKGINDYMERFPRLHLEHSAGDDFSKLLVAAVMLYQAIKEGRHLQYVHQIVDFFEPYQDEYSGAFPEIDPFGKHARTELKNKKYGTGESALYTQPTDTISDQLYSLGFLAMGLYFASKTGNVPKAKPMLTRLLDYLCSIQLDSANPQLDGAWTRGFDYRRGEPYGANGDVGWGAYCIETGWTMGPILTALALYLLDFDPFGPLDHRLEKSVRGDYYEEKKIQEDLEQEWTEHTPRPVKHFTKMSEDEIQESLKAFKPNSIDGT